MTTDVTTRTFQGDNGRDEFERENVADKVISLLTSEIDISPLVIDGGWGTGKTEFCHKLINKFSIAHKEYKLVYVDAFQADHANNPLLTILSAIMAHLPENGGKQTLLQKSVPVARFMAGTFAKTVVSHVLHQNAEELAAGIEKSLQHAADQVIDASVKSLLKDHETALANVKALQGALADIAKHSPIVVFIDELDRCRPDFAVQVLEVIKHTLHVRGVQFVLITNTQQLTAAIEHQYGPKVNAKRYLDKFLKYSFGLPDFLPERSSQTGKQVMASGEHFSLLTNLSAVLNGTDVSKKETDASQFTESLIRINTLSLREVETLVRHLEIYHRLSTGLKSNTAVGYQLLRIFGVFVFCFAPEIADTIQMSRSANAERVTALLGLTGLPSPDSAQYGYPSSSVIGVMLAQACEDRNTGPETKESDSRKFWDGEINRFFGGGARRPSSPFKPVQEAITCLRLVSA